MFTLAQIDKHMDFFLNDQNCIERLFHEWKTYGQIIVAYDYDNTVFDYYKKGYKYDKVIEQLRTLKQMGCHLIVFTSCDETRYPEIKEYLKQNNIPYDTINESPDFIPFKGRKVYYNILLDDRAGLLSAYNQLQEVIQLMRIHKHDQSLSKAQDIDF